jgi:hypothetical protein
MGTFVSFDITLASETYETTIISNSTVSNFRFEVGPETGNRIMQFDVMGEDESSGFARVAVPLKLMNYSLIVFIGEQEVVPVVLSVSDRTQTYLYLTYFHSNLTISITSSKTLSSYNDLLNKFLKLQTDFNNLSMTYNSLINNYSISLQEALQNLNNSYSELLDNYTAVLDRYNELQLEYQALKAAYEDNVQNTRNLMYIFAGMAGTLILAVLYLSRRGTPQKIRAQERKE